MSNAHGFLLLLLSRMRDLRLAADVDQSEIEEELILGPGWIERFETGETTPSIDMVLAILRLSKASLSDLLTGLPEPDAAKIERCVVAEQVLGGVRITFSYGKHDATHLLAHASLADYETVLKVLRDGLAKLTGPIDVRESIKSDAVADCFLKATALFPELNPSDLWWFLVYRVYCDPYNHPASFARLDMTQSWKRTGGWALEKVLKIHYGSFLKENGINLFIADSQTKRAIIKDLGLTARIEADKIDLILTGDVGDGERFFGIVNVKASFAERRTDDEPLSKLLTEQGYLAPFWTMDCKSTPGTAPINRGELGAVKGRISAKRLDMEQGGIFSGCFSYNQNTLPSSIDLPAEDRIYVCDFNHPDDSFSQFIIQRWQRFRQL